MLWLGHKVSMPYMVCSCSDIIKQLYTHYPTSIAAKTHHSIVLNTRAVLLSVSGRILWWVGVDSAILFPHTVEPLNEDTLGTW